MYPKGSSDQKTYCYANVCGPSGFRFVLPRSTVRRKRAGKFVLYEYRRDNVGSDRYQMRIKPYILLLMLFSLVLVVAPQVRAASEKSKEYQIKAAFLYNFINFVDWPKEKVVDNNDLITIGIIGTDPFGKAFEPLNNKQAKGKKVLIKRFKGLEESIKSSNQIEAIRKCHLLFVCRSEKQQLRKIINNIVKDHSVLTVGDMNDFLESGGIINFVIEDQKVRFEINNNTAKQTKLNIRSKLLRLAKKVIEEETTDKTEN